MCYWCQSLQASSYWVGKCGHGLTRPRESASGAFLKELLQLFQCLPWSGLALLAGTLPLKYCAVKFASEVPTWRLPVSRHAAGLVTAGLGVVVGPRLVMRRCNGLRIRLNRKNPAQLLGSSVIQSRPRVWKRLHHVGHAVVSFAHCKRRRYDQQDEGYVPVQLRIGVG